jgi:predicted RNase H-like nuclease (RuvC/YqgF family)
MTIIDEATSGVTTQTPAKMRIFEHMAEALEDQVAGLYRRAATFEEEEFLLNREVEERQTEINRLMLKLEAMRAERDRVMDSIESISNEATAIRGVVSSGEGASTFDSIESESATSTRPAFNGNGPVRDSAFCGA